MRGRKVILFELNEVPSRILDSFCRWRPESVFARRRAEFREYQSVTEDVGHLSPWRTWPTLHRGVTNERHGIEHFGEQLNEVDAAYPPIWRLLAEAGVRTGVGGSLHSYPLPADLEGYAFYLPDTFAAGSECFPRRLESFQALNLEMAGRSARNVDAGIPWGPALRFLAAAPGLGLKPATFAGLASQLGAERLEPWKRVRRRTSQTELAFDVFMGELQRGRPDFATFFTNHVASSMHRYWAAAFPDDYDEFGYDEDWVRRFRGEIDFTMRRFDRMLGRLLRFTDRNSAYTLVITTSMGQAATSAQPVEAQLYVTDLSRFMSALGVPPEGWTRTPAMLPQVNVSVAAAFRETLGRGLASFVVGGRPFEYHEKNDGFFCLEFGHPDLHRRPEVALLHGRETSYEELGIENTRIEDVTGSNAYHVPEGELLVHDPRGEVVSGGPAQLSTVEIAPWLLGNFGLRAPDYMRKPPSL